MSALVNNFDPQTIEYLEEDLSTPESTCAEMLRWLELRFNEGPISALLRIVRSDIEALLRLIRTALDEISVGSMNDSVMQERLGHFALGANNRDFLTQRLLDQTITDIRTTIEQCEKAHAALRAEMSILKSKRGIAEAESVARLTELAFFFIPLTFASSVFSMQVQELQGPTPLYAFIVTALVIVSISYSVRLVQRSSFVSRLKQSTAWRVRPETNVTGKYIPTLMFVRRLHRRLRWAPLVPMLGLFAFVPVVAVLWTRVKLHFRRNDSSS